MKNFIKTYWKTLLFFGIVGLIGGFFVGIYQLDSFPAEMKQQFLDEMIASGITQIPAELFLGIVSALQSVGYGVGLGAVGISCNAILDERKFMFLVLYHDLQNHIQVIAASPNALDSHRVGMDGCVITFWFRK